MKVLVIFCDSFGYKTGEKTLAELPDEQKSKAYDKCVVAFIQVESADEEKDVLSREKKLTNHLKWTARKNNCNRIILHSFAHLSDSKASILFTKSMFDATELRLKNGGFEVEQTPFGYFLDLQISAPGFSLARIWASL